MSYDNGKVRITFNKLKDQMYRQVAKIVDIEYVKTDYKKGNTPPVDGWEPFPENTRIEEKESHYWFRANYKTPKASKDTYYILRCITGRENQWNGENPQALLYLNGEMVQGYDSNHTEAYLDADTDYQIHNYFYKSYCNALVDHKFTVMAVNSKIEKLYYDMRVPYESCLMLEETDENYLRVMSVLVRTANIIDFRNPFSDAYYASIDAALAFIEEELYNKLCSTEGKPVVNCIGHSHIDIEWLWTRYQTREKIQRTFSTVKSLMKKYPEFKFMLSQPENYQFLKEEAPEEYEKLKELVKQGKWEPEGAMFVESDCNLVSGESFVRQIIHGKRFFKEEFGIDSRILFLPDIFGFSGALPQIMKKSGIDYFVTTKLGLNDTNKMPHDTFIWEGIDGSEVLANFITSQEYSKIPQRRTVYGGMLNPKWVKGNWNRYTDKDYARSTIMTFGWGDGGGGPTSEMLENYKRLSKGIPGMPVAKSNFLMPTLKDIEAQFKESCERVQNVPRWVGEFYFEFHRGTYTSVAKNKLGNRKSEFMLHNAEALSYTDLMLGGDYDSKALDNNWKLLLHNQFHDVIPGSAIKEVYELSDIDYANIKSYYGDLESKKLSKLAESVKATKGILVYNPLGFERKGIVNVDGTTYETEDKIAPFGWKVVDRLSLNNSVSLNGLTAENSHYILTIDNLGRITRLYDKDAEREVFTNGKLGNEIEIFEDYPNVYENWEISNYYTQKKYSADDECEIKAVTDGARSGFAIKRKYLNSTLSQNIWLYSDSRRIDFENNIDWHEEHQLLKFAFPLDIHTGTAKYETQFGFVERPTHKNTSWDEAKFEVCAHKWVDLSEGGYGIALLNDCKYGYNIENGTLKLTAIKCCKWPHLTDQGEHKFTYSLLPHIGDILEGGVVNEAYSLNQPLLTANVSAEKGSLDNEFSLVSVDKANVIIDTVKKAEEDESLIVRMFDAFNSKTKATVTVADGFKKAYLCDLLENNLVELDFVGNKVNVPISNFEIVTLKFSK